MEIVKEELTSDQYICEICSHRAECHYYKKGSFLLYFQDPVKNWKEEPKVYNCCYNCSLDLVQFENFQPLELDFQFNRKEIKQL